MLLGDRVGHEADEEGRGPVLHRRVYHIEDLYDLQCEKINKTDWNKVLKLKVDFSSHL